MKAYYTLSGAQWILKSYPMFGNAANISEGAIVMAGATSGTNQGFAILGASALATVLGIMTVKHTSAAAGDDSKSDGTKYTYLNKKVIINPDAVVLADHVAAATAAINPTSVSTTTVNNGSAEGNIQGGWLVGDDNQCQYITASSANTSFTTKSSSGWSSTTNLAKINPIFFSLLAVDSTATKIQNAAGAGTAKVRTLENYIRSKAVPFQRLDPTKHSGTTFDSGLVISTELIFRDHYLGQSNN